MCHINNLTAPVIPKKDNQSLHFLYEYPKAVSSITAFYCFVSFFPKWQLPYREISLKKISRNLSLKGSLWVIKQNKYYRRQGHFMFETVFKNVWKQKQTKQWHVLSKCTQGTHHQSRILTILPLYINMLESVYMLKLFSVFCLVPHTPPSSPPLQPNYANALQKFYSSICRSCTVQDL